MLCAGRFVPKLFPVNPISVRRLIVFNGGSCHTCALPLCGKFAILKLAGVLPERYLLMTMMVSAPSADRSAAKTETLSGFGPVAATLLSPNVDLLPSALRYIFL